VFVLFMFMACVPALAHAQASIAGVVRDPSGGVLPGVTVEASSPALIEKVRSVVTDGSGQYRVVDLRPGTYTVTFTLSGFSTVRREGIELTGSFVATVDVDLRVGALEETITVTGDSPIVDIQRTTQQRVFDQQVIEQIPAGRSHINMVVLIPGLAAPQPGRGALATAAVLVRNSPPAALAAIEVSATPDSKIVSALIVPVTNETMNTSITACSPCCDGRSERAVPYATAAVP
jgi:hypothetical protein